MKFTPAKTPPQSRSKYAPVVRACQMNPNTWYEAEYSGNDYQGLRARGLEVVKRGDVMYFRWINEEA